MSMIERGSVGPVQQYQALPKTPQPSAPTFNSTIHQQADNSSQSCNCFSWICDVISSFFSTILKWFCGEQIDESKTHLSFLFGHKDISKEMANVKKCANVKELKIGDIKVSDEELAALLEKCPNLEKVIFDNYTLAGDKVSEALAKLPYLRELTTPRKMSEPFFSKICSLPLTHLNISYFPELKNESLNHLDKLTSLTHFECHYVDQEKSDILFSKLAHLPIQVLDFSNCYQIDPSSWEAFLPKMKQVVELNLLSTKTTDKVISAISTLPLLQKLAVSNAYVGPRYERITEAGYWFIVDKMKNLTALTISDINHDGCISSGVIDAYSSELPKLRLLKVEDCDEFLTKHLDFVRKKRPNITVEDW